MRCAATLCSNIPRIRKTILRSWSFELQSGIAARLRESLRVWPGFQWTYVDTTGGPEHSVIPLTIV